MILSPSFWVLLYLIQLLIISLSLGALTIHQPRLLMVPRLSRFMIGFCVSPFLLGVWMLLLAAIIPGASKWLVLIPPLIIAVILLILYGSHTFRRLIRDYQRARRLSGNVWLSYLIYTAAILVLTVTVSKLVINSQTPNLASDASRYLREALIFAKVGSLSATTDFKGWPDGTFRGDLHSFLFPSFLSHALLTTGDNPLGYPYDQAARAAFQVTFIYMLLSVVALAGTTRYLGAGALAVLLFLQVPQLEYISYQNSRDAYRIIPLMLLATTLVGLSPHRLRHRLRLLALLPPLILAAFSLAGHTLGGFVTVSIAMAWAVWNLFYKARWLNLLLILSAVGVGLLLIGSPQYIKAYIETGNIRGDNAIKENAIIGTPLWEENLERNETRLEGATNTFQRLGVLLGRDSYRLSVPGLLGALISIIFWAKYKREKWARLLFFFALMVVTIALPFLGLFDLTGIKLSEWFIMNLRYPLHWYPFAAVCITALVCYLYNRFTSHFKNMPLFFGISSLILSTLVLAVAYSAYETVSAPSWRTGQTEQFKLLLRNLDPMKITLQDLPVGKKLLIDDERYNYYLDNQAIILYSQPTWEVIQARNEKEVRKALKVLNIEAVVFKETNISGWWDQLPLFDFLNNPDNTVLIFNDQFRVYRIIENELDRKQVIDTYLREADASLDGTYAIVMGIRPLDMSINKDFLVPGELDEMLSLYERFVELTPTDPISRFVLARLYQSAGKLDKSIAQYKQAIALIPQDEWLYFYLAEAYIAKSESIEEYNQGIEAYRRAFMLAPDNKVIRKAIIEAYLFSDARHFDQNLIAEVITAYQNDIQREPDNEQLYWDLAEVYIILDRPDDAAAIYGDILERWPDNAAAAYALGQVREQQENVEAAISAYETAIKLDPTLAGAYIKLGNLYQAQDQPDEALTLYRTAARKNTEAAWPRLELGKFYLEQATQGEAN